MLLNTIVVARSNMCPFEMFSLQLTIQDLTNIFKFKQKFKYNSLVAYY